MGKMSRLGNELYQGRKSIDFVGRKRVWYAVSALLIIAALLVIFLRGLNFGIEFTGGTQYRVPVSAGQATQANADKLREAVAGTGIENASSPIVTTAGDEAITVQTEALTRDEGTEVGAAISEAIGVNPTDLSQEEIGASWGQEVAERALLGVGVFLVLVVLFIWAYFREWKMSVAALVALFHDIVITIGVYALSGFQVTPSAVTGLLAILGFSLYDTVVVFDKVRENTHALRKSSQSYAQAANLAVNQTLVRSVNTAIVALIPIGAILWVSAVQLGASSLQDLALSQFVGMAIGVYSSIFLAPRLLVQMKSSEDSVKAADRRAKSRAKAEADRYASVPSFSESLPVGEEPDGQGLDPEDDEEPGESRPSVRTAPPRQPEATGRGRVVPTTTRPVQQSNASGRVQPTRQTKAKREKQ